ncbi:MAG: ABC transporter ATP-binding protein [Rhodobacteraceae bacterium]|nr:ABC transporter ATP-binding protein [Paracoccaceae bacterium]
MTSLVDILPDFASLNVVASSSPAISDADLETERLEAFENGYKAGWDDAAKAHIDETQRINGTLAQNLMDLSFTRAEVHAQTMKALVPVFRQLTDVLLPEMARGALTGHIVQELERYAQQAIDEAIEIRVAPDAAEQTRAAIPETSGLAVSVVADTRLSEGQADLRIADRELQIDLPDALADVRSLIAGFEHEAMKEVADG